MLQAGRSTPAPPASPVDPAVFLEAILSPEVDLIKLAARLSVSLQDLAALATHPAILSYLAAIDELADLRFRLIAADARLKAIKSLTELLDAPGADPVERRRVAALLLRALNRPANNGYAQRSTPARVPAQALMTAPVWPGERAASAMHDAVAINAARPGPASAESAGSEVLASDTPCAPPTWSPCAALLDQPRAGGAILTPREAAGPRDRALARGTELLEMPQPRPRLARTGQPPRFSFSPPNQRANPTGLLAVAGHASPAQYSRRARAP